MKLTFEAWFPKPKNSVLSFGHIPYTAKAVNIAEPIIVYIINSWYKAIFPNPPCFGTR